MSHDHGDTRTPELTPGAGTEALRGHLVERAESARLKYGLYIDAEAILDMLRDPAIVRYPVTVRFDAAALRPGEFAHAEPVGPRPDGGFRLSIHPHFEKQPDIWPLLIAYHIVDINYGAIATAAEAELFGATLLGIEVDAYYQALCELADDLPCASGCSCGDGGPAV